MWTKNFWKKTAERAIKSAAQSAILVLGADQVDAFAIGWGEVGSFALGGAFLSVLTSLISSGLSGPGNDPSLVQDRPDRLGD